MGLSKWLLDYQTKRTISSAKISFPVYLQFVGQQLKIITGDPPYGIKNHVRITRQIIREAKPKVWRSSPLDQALKYAEVLNEPSVVSKNQVAKRFGVSRARACQLLNLLELNPSILQQLQSIKDVDEHNFWTERRLRKIAGMKKFEQISAFNRLRQEQQVHSKNTAKEPD